MVTKILRTFLKNDKNHYSNIQVPYEVPENNIRILPMDVNNFPMKSQANYEKKKSPKYSNVIFPTKSQANFPKKKPPK